MAIIDAHGYCERCGDEVCPGEQCTDVACPYRVDFRDKNAHTLAAWMLLACFASALVGAAAAWLITRGM